MRLYSGGCPLRSRPAPSTSYCSGNAARASGRYINDGDSRGSLGERNRSAGERHAGDGQRVACASPHSGWQLTCAAFLLVRLATVEGVFAISDRPFARTVIRYLLPKVP
jgi:hypothetical protein